MSTKLAARAAALLGVLVLAAEAFAPPARAEQAQVNGIIFVDASASVQAFAEAYRQSMQGLSSRAREKFAEHRTRIHFVPIGDGSGATRVLPNTGMSFEELRAAMSGPFSFTAKKTLLSEALARGRTVANVARMMIVSDFVPDFSNSREPFRFSRDDMRDLLKAKDIVKSYLDNPKLEKLGIILLGWDRDPESYLDERERANPDAVIEKARRTNEQRLGSAGPEREDGDETLYRKATAAAIISLKKASAKLTVTAMALSVGNSRNEQGFFIEACRTFDAVLSGDARCSASGGERDQQCAAGARRGVKDAFTVAVDRGRYRNDEFLLPRLVEQFSAPLQGPRLVTPRRITIVDSTAAAAATADYRVTLCPLQSAGARVCGGPHAAPNLQLLGRKLEGKASENSTSLDVIEPVSSVSASGPNPSEAARNSLANDLARNLRTHIGDTHRPPRQDLWVSLKTAAGMAIPRGHLIAAKYSVLGSAQKSEGTVLDETGTVVLPLPAAAENVELFHFSKRTRIEAPGRAPTADAEVPLGAAVPQRFVGSCEIYNHVVQDNLFLPVRISVKWPDSARIAASSKRGRLQVSLEDTDYEQPVPRDAIVGDQVQNVELPPGNYKVTLKVDDPRLLQPDLVPKPWPANSALAGRGALEFRAPQPDTPEQVIEFRVGVDPLLRPETDPQVATEQVHVMPNYLAPPVPVWVVLKEFMNNDRLTPRGERTLVQSANVFWGALSAANYVINAAARGVASTDIDPTQLRTFLRATQLQVVERANQDSNITRDISRGMRRIGLVMEDGRDLPHAQKLISLLLVRIVEGNFCSTPATALQMISRPSSQFTREVIDEYNNWLLQSTVRNDQRASEAATNDISARVSHTPFTIELARRCHIPFDNPDGP